MGSVLGDGCIEINNRKRGYYRLTIKHGEKQREYVNYKYQLLKNLCAPPKEDFRKDIRQGFKDGVVISLRTTTNPIFKIWRERWYPNNKKTINKEDLYKLKSLGLAIWIMDDGYWSGNSIVLCTQSFSKECLIIIHDFFKSKGVAIGIHKQGSIRIFSKDVYKIIKAVSPYIIESMRYKVRLKQGELLETPTLERQKEDNQQPSLDSNILEGSTTNSRILPNKVEDSNANTSALHI